MLRTCVRVAVAALVAATAYVALPAAPATAAGCSTADGVTVVVDYRELGGGVQTGCVADGGGRTAAELYPAAGFALSYVQRQPGFVCRVEGKPADDPCVNTPPSNAYWGLFWSDGESGSWTYATVGAGGLRIPDGGYVGFSWQSSAARTGPGFTPAPHPSPTPTPTEHPTHPSSSHSAHPSPQHSASSSATPTASDSASPSATASASAKPHDKKSHAAKPTATTSSEPAEPAEPSASTDAVPAAAEPTEPDDGLPGWVAPVVVVLLFGAVGAVAVVRRRRGGAA